jgi:hypothetical protein
MSSPTCRYRAIKGLGLGYYTNEFSALVLQSRIIRATPFDRKKVLVN